VLTHLVAIWRRSSEEMAVLARANDIRYLHVLQPNQYVEGSKPMGPDERRIATPPDHPYRDGAVLGYPLLRAESGRLRASGVEFYDATGLFADVEEPLYVDGCCHFNRRGNEILARFLAARILEGLAAPSP
jgi:hypothetical protein